MVTEGGEVVVFARAEWARKAARKFAKKGRFEEAGMFGQVGLLGGARILEGGIRWLFWQRSSPGLHN